MRTVEFYETTEGKCPVAEYLDSLDAKDAAKIAFSISLVEELEVVPTTYFKKLDGEIYEIRAQRGNNIFRLLGFFYKGNLVICTSGFTKKTQKTPAKEIILADNRRKDYINRKGAGK